MLTSVTRSGRTAVMLGVLGALMLVVLAGCGSSSSSSAQSSTQASNTSAHASTKAAAATVSGQLAQAKADVAKLLSRPTKIGITQPITGKIPTGKTIDWVVCDVPACLNSKASLEAATKALGWKLSVILAGSTPEAVQASMQKAIADKPSAVIEQTGFPTATITTQVAQLKKMGIPIVGDGLGLASPPSGYIGLEQSGAFYSYIGVRNAQFIAAAHACKSDTLVVNVTAYAVQEFQNTAFAAEMKKICGSSAKLQYYDAPLTSIGGGLPSQIATLVQANPKIDSILLGWADLAQGVPQALQGVGVDPKKLTILMSNQDGTTVQQLKAGDVSATFAQPTGEISFNIIDTLARHFTHQSVVPDQALAAYPSWFTTPKTLPTQTNNAIGWDVVPDYAAQYEKLWGVS
jgi:ABC-type sugar transport system substrate-binding protein